MAVTNTGRRRPPAITFREEIERAESEGVKRTAMKLQLTLADASLLKRDNTLAVTDISFSEGVMRFLGVVVQEGGVVTSTLVKA